MKHIRTEVRLRIDGLTVQELEESLRDIPADAQVDTYHYNSGNDPRESDYTEIIFTWSTDAK